MTMTPIENRQFWENEEKKLDELVNKAMWPGGQKAVDLLAKRNKQPPRELIQKLIDPGTYFFELSSIAGFRRELSRALRMFIAGGLSPVSEKSTATGP